MPIKQILLKNSNEWIDYDESQFEFKNIRLKCSKNESLHLMYKDIPVVRVRYSCDVCGIVRESDWGKYKNQQYLKNKCMCRLCSIQTEENKNKISERTKRAMQTDIVKKHHSEAQKKRFQQKEEKLKSSIRSKEIMSRDGMKQLVRERTKQAMASIPKEELISTKNMTPEQIVDYRRRIGQKISENYNEETKRKCLESREKHFANNIEAQNKIINASRNNQLKTISEPQRVVTEFLQSYGEFDIVEEFPINVWDDLKFDKSFVLSDIYIKNLNIIVEVMGNWWHKYFLADLDGQEIEKDNKDLLKVYHKDLIKDEIYKSKQFNVIYFQETELETERWKETLIKRIKEYVK